MLRRNLLHLGLLILIAAITLEAALTVLDPLGLRWVHQLGFMQPFYEGETLDYHLRPGLYRMGTWSATVNTQGQRRVPDSGAGCRLAIFGDSVIWGWGVNDEQTFVNLLARDWPGETVNAGQIGYNSAQVRANVERSNFDQALYLIVWNDADETVAGTYHADEAATIYPGFGLLQGGSSAVLAYGHYMRFLLSDAPRTAYPQDRPRFLADLDWMVGQGVTLAAFDDGRLQLPDSVRMIPPYTQRLGAIDWHPDVAGHMEIAAALGSIVDRLTC